MKCRAIISACVLIAASIGFAVPAMATPSSESFILDTWRGGAGVTGNNFGTVLLTQDGANVDVLVTPTSGNGFVNTGAGDSLLFDLNGISSVTIQNMTTGFSAVSTNAGSYSGGGVGGGFNYAIQCSGCGNGGSSVLTGPLGFTINGITLADFHTSDNGYYFASDLCVGTSTGGNGKLTCSGGNTGNVSAEFDAAVPVPEPLTLSLFGAGLAGAFAARRRKKA